MRRRSRFGSPNGLSRGVLSIGKLALGQESYYPGAVAHGSEDYYLGGADIPGYRTGRGAEEYTFSAECPGGKARHDVNITRTIFSPCSLCAA